MELPSCLQTYIQSLESFTPCAWPPGGGTFISDQQVGVRDGKE